VKTGMERATFLWFIFGGYVGKPGSSANGLNDRRKTVLFPAGCRRFKTGCGARVFLCPTCEGYFVGAEAVGTWN
jgi:hypothetical protein